MAATTAAASQVSDWLRLCGDDGRCTVSARIVPQDGGPRFATVAIGFDEQSGGDPFLTIAAPLGIAVPAGVRLLVDDETALDARVDVCLPDGCRAGRPLEPEDLRVLREAETLEVRYFVAADGALRAAPLSANGLAPLLREFAP